MKDIKSRITYALLNECRIAAEDLLIVGVSGGIDSMFLLDQLHRIGQPLIAAVFDHGLRPESGEEAAFVRDYCTGKDIPCVLSSGDVIAYAGNERIGIEEAARMLRYRFLFETALENKAAAVVTAHHANDQAETVLMHLLRGAGIDGLSGIRSFALPNAFSKTIPLVRPLLGITRTEIEAYMSEAGTPYREDQSNRNPDYTRNHIRMDLIPRLKQDYNPGIIQALCRLAETAAADKEYLISETDRAMQYAGFRLRDFGAEWYRKTYCSYPPALRLRFLRKIIQRISDDSIEAGYQNLKEADEFFMHARLNQMCPFSGGYQLRCEGNKAIFLKDPGIKQWKYPQIFQGWELSSETRIISKNDLPDWMEKAKTHPEIAVLDANQLASAPFLRTIQPGERFHPYGGGGNSQKLSDFLINNKVPKDYRQELAVAADDAGIVWVPGLRVSNRCALSSHTHRIMILKLLNPS